MRRRASRLPDARPDLTSMIDVVFLLLIFFLCTMQFRVLEGRLETELPDEGGPSPATPEVVRLYEPLDLHVRRAGDAPRVRVGLGAEHSLAALPGVLARLTDDGLAPTVPVRVHALDGTTYGDVVPVLDACLGAGLVTLHFAGPR